MKKTLREETEHPCIYTVEKDDYAPLQTVDAQHMEQK